MYTFITSFHYFLLAISVSLSLLQNTRTTHVYTRTHTHTHPHTHTPGNHESITMNQMYGFEGEVKSKYSATMAELFTELFEWLPLAHCIEGKILV